MLTIGHGPASIKDRREANSEINRHLSDNPLESTFEARNTLGRLLWAINKADAGQREFARPTLNAAHHLVTTLSASETRWVRDQLLPLANTEDSHACDEVFRLNNRLDLDFGEDVTAKGRWTP